jgi:glucoamylase
MNKEIRFAPGWPGIPARWTTGAKSGVGTSCNTASAVWFTLSHGVVNEVYYPRVDHACTRDMEFIVTDGKDFFSEEQKHTHQHIELLADGVPAYRLINTCKYGNYRIEKEIITDPFRSSLIQHVRFTSLRKDSRRHNLYVLLAPHIGNYGAGNNAWLGEYKGVPMLFAEREGTVLALACSIPWKKMSVGFVGSSDGFQDISRHKKMTWLHDRAENGNVALTAEIDLSHAEPEGFTLVVGFGRNHTAAAQVARASIIDGYENAKDSYIKEWKGWQNTLVSYEPLNKMPHDLYRISTFVLRAHAAKRLPGGMIASLSIPWGFSKGDDDIGGYHLVWPRDLGETGGGLLASKAWDDARKVLNYLMTTQEPDGRWPQNMWLDGTCYWPGVQMDETAFPILLVDLARRKGFLEEVDLKHFWPMVFKAAGHIVCNGPVSQQDRWEENEGYTPFTIACEIAALLAAADIAELNERPEVATFLRETADAWNDNIEKWLYVRNTPIAERAGVDGYYVRIMPPEAAESDFNYPGTVAIKNTPKEESVKRAEEVVSPDALALVRFGLRAADDPRILNTVRVIDEMLKVDTPYGPCWYRYNYDGYGEHADGSPYNGIGIGRPWPLLTGERAHYEIAAGNFEGARKLMAAMEAFANEGGMLPEQIWDGNDVPERDLYFGRASGSAMPLVWAHAEYIKLCRSLKEKKVFDMPPQTYQRYVVEKVSSYYAIWNFNNKQQTISAGKILRIETLASCIVHWTTDDWATSHDTYTRETGLGNHIANLSTHDLAPGTKITFTFYWTEVDKWENKDFTITLKKEQNKTQYTAPVFIHDAIKNILDTGSKITGIFKGRNINIWSSNK